MSPDYASLYRQSIDHPDSYWAEQARLVHWHRHWEHVCDDSRPPFSRWFIGGETNLCYNAVDRHLGARAHQPALIYVSSETGVERTYTFAELHQQVNQTAAMLLALGARRGERVLIYMPMIPEAVFAMLACVRIGAIHSVVFGGFAAHSLASRIDDARPCLIVSADAGSRGGKVIPYKPLLDEAIELAQHKPAQVLLADRGLEPMRRVTGRDVDWTELQSRHADAQVECVWLESSEPSYILYTSGTTGRPKGVQRDTGGYAVALAASMKHIYDGRAGETFFATSDIGWVVGHSYIVYGPLLAGMATVLYEGTPMRPDAGTWWRIAAEHGVTVMFTAPTALRVLKKYDADWITRHDLSRLRSLFVAGEPLDEPTAAWIGGVLKKPIIDNYWQTETGWPILASPRGVAGVLPRLGSPGKPMPGFDVRLVHEHEGSEIGNNEKGLLALAGPLPPGCMSTVWGDDERYQRTYWQLRDSRSAARTLYSSFDWGIRDDDGYYFILGRSDDVINIAGHRLGTREIEEAVCAHPAVVEAAVVGVSDTLKGQAAIAFVILRDADAWSSPEARLRLEGEVMQTVDHHIGGIGRPARVYAVQALPKTRSGKLLRRVIQSICEGRAEGDLTTLEDPAALEQIRAAVRGKF